MQKAISLNSLSAASFQIGVLILILLLFIGNLTGFLEFGANTDSGLAINPQALFNSSYSYSVPNLLDYPEFSILLVTGLLLAFLLPVVTPYAACALVVLAALPMLYLGLNYPFRETPLPMQYSLLVIMVLFGVNVLINYFEDTRRKQRLVEVFGRYIPPQLAEQLSRQSELLNLKGESRELTICFCDLINFTQMAEQLKPEDVVSVLNEYFTVMTEVLYEHGATIDKYMGDCVMAFWGAPVPQEDHAQRAVRAALEIQERIHELTLSFAKRGLPAPDIGIGINTGVVNVGNMGSRYRLAYTVIGDAVNIAFRLEDLTRAYCAPIVVGQRTRELVTGVVFKELDRVKVRGKTQETRIYQPVCYDEQLPQATSRYLDSHRDALENYYAGQTQLAAEQFQQLLDTGEHPGYYRYMLKQLAAYSIDTPPRG